MRVVDNILYRTSEDTNGLSRTQFVLPKQITNEVIEQIHSSVYNAHLGRKKTMEKIIQRMYRPFLKEDIIKIVKSCDMCQKIKAQQSKNLAQLLYLTPMKPNQLITTDIAGPLKETARGNKYFIVIIDHFTKFIQVYPLRRIQAEDVAEVIVNNWICIFGIPESILTDGGTQYRSSLLELIYEYLDLKSMKTTPFHPQCNGQIERIVQTAKAMIRSYVDEDQANWDMNLSKLNHLHITPLHTVQQNKHRLNFNWEESQLFQLI